MNLEYVVVGTARNGSVHMARLLSSMGVMCGHESLFSVYGVVWAMQLMESKQPVTSPVSTFEVLAQSQNPEWFVAEQMRAESSWMAVPYLDHKCLRNVSVVHSVRNPLKVISSLVSDAHVFADDPKHLWVFQEFAELHAPVLRLLDEVERACYHWTRWHQMILDKCSVKALPYYLHRLEDGPTAGLLDFLKLPQSRIEGAFSNLSTNTWKLRDADLTLADIPAGHVKKRFIELAAQLGYLDLA